MPNKPQAVVGRVPFDQAIDHFKSKEIVTTKRWDDMISGEHSRAFTVAGVTSVEMANDFKKALDEIRENGGGIEDFRKDFDKIVARYGWEYHGDRSWRTGIIFRTNLRTSNAAGRWEQIAKSQAALKSRDPNASLFLEYNVLDNGPTRRALHQSWEGTTLPVEHPWWREYYPPNDYECGCWVRVLSPGYMARNNISETPEAPFTESTERVNQTTGEVYPPTPEGIGVGFNHNHGGGAYFPTGANLVDARFGTKLAKLNTQSDDFADLVNGKQEGTATVGFLPDGVADLLGAKTSRIAITSKSIADQATTKKAATLADYKRLPDLVDKGLIIKDAGVVYIFLTVGKTTYKATVDSTDAGKVLAVKSLVKTTKAALNKLRKSGTVIREAI